MLIHREALELAKNAAPAGDGVPFTTNCVIIGEDGAVTAQARTCPARPIGRSPKPRA